ncbi:hypothetical protein Y1Q_0021511 [Alligator mississippiensis]|uniref:Secreted protein n=1 Tax=Alligator mississippiensis TaxID=8496 RepID=A0A151PA75_ALLMI|nr:hypothetical protein Y1Q_0021511 [Alligator mississippiensis]
MAELPRSAVAGLLLWLMRLQESTRVYLHLPGGDDQWFPEGPDATTLAYPARIEITRILPSISKIATKQGNLTVNLTICS